jgi:very-short-patch-repair endonuclease
LESEVKQFLENNKIDFIQQKSFDWLKDKKKLHLDFYLPSYKLAIECQGEQHFMPNDYFGGEEKFSQIIFRDNLKYELCKQHNIKILYFTHCNFKYSHTVITSLEKLKEAIFE